jgi:predicted enzyme related to lactoylglutathione lyase
MARITGVGGVFFKSKGDGAALAAWYRKHLGLELEPWGGAVLKWPDDKAEDQGLTVWHVASSDSKWFSPSQSSFMINYRVDNMGELLEQLWAGGVEVLQGPESHENGKFAWIMDPDGKRSSSGSRSCGTTRTKGREPRRRTVEVGLARALVIKPRAFPIMYVPLQIIDRAIGCTL